MNDTLFSNLLIVSEPEINQGIMGLTVENPGFNVFI